MKNFKDYGLSEEILKAIKLLNYTEPTEVQQKVIPLALENKDIVVKSQTGSGKTASFAIPVAEQIDWEENRPQALVITPTRELAMQVGEDFFNIGRFKRLKVVPIFGKAAFYNQQQALKQKTHVVVGTPGRLLDHLDNGTLDVSMVKYLIIDEADEMFNMGFLEDVEAIIDQLPFERLTMLFSATLPSHIEALTRDYMTNPEHIEIEDENLVVDEIEQFAYKVEEDDKIQLLKDVTVVESPDTCIIFANTRDQVDEIYEELSNQYYTVDRIHGGMDQKDRTRVMENFRLGKFRYLVATDVAARGIDVNNISHVINFDVPIERESYVHRIGRTGRVGKTGKAITFITSIEEEHIRDIEDYIEAEIPILVKPSQEDVLNLKYLFDKKKNKRPELKKQKNEDLDKNIMKIHINAGKKTKMRAVDIVGAFSNLKGMTADDIGVINIHDISTFVEILNGKGEMVLKQLQTTKIKGRIRNVNKANEY